MIFFNYSVDLQQMDQLIEGLSENINALQTDLGFIRHELYLLYFDFSGTKHAHLSSLLAVIQQQAELFTGMRVSLKRLYPNDTHRNFLRFVDGPMGEVIKACMELTKEVSK